MTCPNCSSDQIQRISAIYEAGTSVVETTTTGGGVAFSKDGMAPILAASSSTGTQQTKLAARATPPARRPVGKAIVAAIVASPILAVVLTLATGFACGLVGASGETIGAVTGIVSWGALATFSVGFVAMAVVDYKFNREEWPVLREEWERKWFCHRCATEFVDAGRSSVTSGALSSRAEVSRSAGAGGELSALLKARSLKPIPTLVGFACVTAILFGAMAVVSPSEPEQVSSRRSPSSVPASPVAARPTPNGPNVVGTTLKEPWTFHAPMSLEQAAKILGSVAVDFAAKSEPGELTNWEAQIVVLDRNVKSHTIGSFNFSFETIRKGLLNPDTNSTEMSPAFREQLDSWIESELAAMDGIEILASGQAPARR
jgi:hypothetical protein